MVKLVVFLGGQGNRPTIEALTFAHQCALLYVCRQHELSYATDGSFAVQQHLSTTSRIQSKHYKP